MVRCVNIDWLEVYCLECLDLYPLNAEFFRNHKWSVKERDYGTRQYREMFVLLDQYDHAFIEIRRDPVSAAEGGGNLGIFDPRSCHIRVANRYCYHDQIIDILSEFFAKYHYTIRRLYRLDIALDFEKFDKGDDPKKFIRRYMEGKYSKINQGNVGAHGKDRWDGRDWNSLSWGSPSSMVSTKFYNKTIELQEAKDKPYIRYAWMKAGLVDNYTTLQKLSEDGSLYNPTIWRVEFSIRSSASNWVVIEDDNRRKTKRIVLQHALSTYRTKEDQLHAFMRLAYHYFHFKKYEEGKRKDRCQDKVLFEYSTNDKGYSLDRLLTDTPQDRTISSLEKKLNCFKLAHPKKKIVQACEVLIEELHNITIRNSLPDFYLQNEALLLQCLIERRMKQSQLPFEDKTTMKDIQQLLSSLDDVF